MQMVKPSKSLVTLQDLQFRWPKQKANLLSISTLCVDKNQHMFIQGSSGSGKTTLLNLMCGINLSTSGSLVVLGEELNRLSSQERDQFRGDHLGVIFQQFNLLPFLTVKENIQLPCHFSKKRFEKINDISEEVLRLLDALDLSSSLMNKNVNELSAGQQQRVAACRAVIGSPELIIADEPTSALDMQNRDRFLQLLFQEAKKHMSTIVFVSHDPTIAHHFPENVDLSLINQGQC
jgi:putative ABC transport system ATP-binding protein